MALAANAAELNFWEWNLVSDEIWFRGKERTDFKKFLQTLHPDDREPLSHAVAKSMNGSGDFKYEYRVLPPSTPMVWMAGLGRVDFDTAGRPVFMRGVSVEITHRKQAEMELQRQREELAHLSRVTMLGELSSSLAHELSQPLGAILRNAEAAEIFLKDPLPDLEEIRAIVTDIRQDEQRAGAIIDRMRSVAKRHEVVATRFDLNLLMEETISLVRPVADLSKIRLVFSPDPSLPKILADRIQLQQVLLNLLLNAKQSIDDVKPENAQIIVRLRMADRQIELSVSDCGHGIPADKLPRLFRTLFHHQAGRTGPGPGHFTEHHRKSREEIYGRRTMPTAEPHFHSHIADEGGCRRVATKIPKLFMCVIALKGRPGGCDERTDG